MSVSNGQNQRKCVLFVDDDGSLLRAMKLILESDYKVNLANSAFRAMESIYRERPDLILLDIEMPICDGRELLKVIRITDETKDIPVIILSGSKNREKLLEVSNIGIQGYLEKGTPANGILEYIHEFFAKNESC